MVYQNPSPTYPPRGGNRSGFPLPPWWYVLYPPHGDFGPPGSSARAVARDVDSLLLPLSPSGRMTRLLEEIDALALVDASVQAACELIADELQPALDEDEEGVLTHLLWIHARDSLMPALVPAIRLRLRSGPALVAATRWQLAGPMRSAVLRSAGTELRSRRQQEPYLDQRLRGAAEEMAHAFPQQKGPALAVGLIILAETALAVELADAVYHHSTGHHIWDDYHS